MEIKPIRSPDDYEKALRRAETLWDAPPGSPQSDELDVLATLIDAYEQQRYPIDLPDPIEAIKFRLEQQGQTARALVGIIGHRTRVHEVLNGKRPLSLNMIRNLHVQLGVPAHVLIQPVHKPRKATRRSRRPTRLQRPSLKKRA